MKILMGALLSLVAVLCFQVVAEAKELSGHVVSVDPKTGVIVLSRNNALTKSTEDISILSDNKTELVGFNSLDALIEGDMVVVSTDDQSLEQPYKATSIELPETIGSAEY